MFSRDYFRLRTAVLHVSGRPLSSFQVDPKPAFAMNNADDTWNLGSVLPGNIIETSVGIANTGFRNLTVGRPTTVGIGLTAELTAPTGIQPLTFKRVQISLDTQGLPTGPYSGVVHIRTNDISHSTQDINVVGTILNPQSQPIVLSSNPYQPLLEHVSVPGGQDQSTVITFTNPIQDNPQPLYVLDSEGAIVARGLDVLGIPSVNYQVFAVTSKQPTPTSPGIAPYSPQDWVAFTVDIDGDGFSKGGATGAWVRIASRAPVYCSTNGSKVYYAATTDSQTWVDWSPNLPATARYRVEAYFPDYSHGSPISSQVDYSISHKDGTTTVVRDQNNGKCSWVDMGTYRFDAGRSGKVNVDNRTGDGRPGLAQRDVSADAVQFVMVPPDTPDIYGISNSDLDENFTVDWSDAFGTTDGYELQEYLQGNLVATYYPWNSYADFAGHAPGDYCYQVRAHNNAGWSNFSGWQCVSIRPALYAPTLYAISNPNYGGNYTLSWGWINWTTQFYLQERLGSGTYNNVYQGLSVNWSATSRSPGIWCYRVIALNERGWSPWSNEQCTTVDMPPNPPVDLQPANGQAVLGRNVSLSWQDGGDPDNLPRSYRDYQMSIRSETGNWSTSRSWSTSTTSNTLVPDDGYYYWKAQSGDGVMGSDWTSENRIAVYSLAKIGPNQVAFALPQPTVQPTRYSVQYGLPFTVQSQLPTTVLVSLPKRYYSQATLDVIFSTSVTATTSIGIDIGGKGLGWNSTMSQPVTSILHSPNLVTALNAYLAAVPETPGTQVHVPIVVSSTLPVEGFITNILLTPGVDTDPLIKANSIQLNSPNPIESDIVTVTAQVGNNGYTATNALVSFFVGDPEKGGQYIGSDFVASVPYSGSINASVKWNTTGYTSTQAIYAVIDAAHQINELNTANNVISRTIVVLSRPQLNVVSLSLSDDEPVASEMVTVKLIVNNAGQSIAPAQNTTLYQGNPDASAMILSNVTAAPIAGGLTQTLYLTWVPTTTGTFHLFARVDRDHQVNQPDRGGNDAWRDVYVGFHGPLLINSGSAGDQGYNAATSFGYVDEQSADVTGACNASVPTFRRDPNGRVVYRFDNLLPGHFYHLDVTMDLCGSAARQESVYVNTFPVAGPEDLGDQHTHRLSILVSPPLYARRSISVSIETAALGGAIVNGVNLYDVDYRYSDAGGAVDPAYPSGLRSFGYLNGTPRTQWGSLPYQSLRENQGGNTVSYRYDGLIPAKNYDLHFSFWQSSTAALIQKVQVNGTDIGPVLNILSGNLYSETVHIPPSAYAGGTITASIVRLDAATSAIVNEIALEERTLTDTIAICNVAVTPDFTELYGGITINGQPAPVETTVEALNPRGDVIGCGTVQADGVYGLLRVYGEDTSTTPATRGMRAGEPIALRVNGAAAVPSPLVYWANDRSVHQAALAAGSITAQLVQFSAGWNLVSFYVEPPMPLVANTLAQIGGSYDRVLGEKGAYDVSLPSVFNSLKELHSGLGYYTHISGTNSTSALIQGLQRPITDAIPLHTGWNFIGYLPTSSLPVTVALGTINAQYDRVLGIKSSFDTTIPLIFSSLKQMDPGQGYLIHITATQAITLTNPTPIALLRPVSTPTDGSSPVDSCADVKPTPSTTLFYGQVHINGHDAPVGTKIEMLTPRGEAAGCYVVDTTGVYGMMNLYGADNTVEPAIPGFMSSETVTFRINGFAAAGSPSLTWQNDLAPHQVDLSATVQTIYLPVVRR